MAATKKQGCSRGGRVYVCAYSTAGVRVRVRVRVCVCVCVCAALFVCVRRIHVVFPQHVSSRRGKNHRSTEITDHIWDAEWTSNRDHYSTEMTVGCVTSIAL